MPCACGSAASRRVFRQHRAVFTRTTRTSRRLIVTAVTAPQQLQALEGLQQWLISKGNLSPQGLEAAEVKDSNFGKVVGCVTSKPCEAEEDVCTIPQDAAVTSVDAEKHPLIGPLVQGRGELTAITLWLMAERASGSSNPLVSALPERTLSPILWDDAFRLDQLRGSPVLEEARTREAALRQEWQDITGMLEELPNAADFPSEHFSENAFLAAFAVVMAHAIYLPSAQCFALLPLVSFMRRTGNDNGCEVDYDLDQEMVVVRAKRPYKAGQEALLNDARPNGERFLVTGALEAINASDYLLYTTQLVQSDRLYSSKREVLAAMEMSDTEIFPLYNDRFPIQLLSFLRFTRVQDAALLAKCSFEQDVIVSPMNEYEVLQLVLADLRDSLQEYYDNEEDDVKLLQSPDLSPEVRMATTLRVCEKKILLSTTDAIRRRLAPIRGIPTKSGKLEDPNADLLEIFEAVEGLGSAPQKLWGSFSRWASGKDDPNFKR